MAKGTRQRAVIYARISHADGDDHESLKIARQVDTCEQIIESEGWELIETFVDDGYSGWNPKVRRPDYERMLEGIDKGAIDVVVTYSLDRLSRRTSVSGVLGERCRGKTRIYIKGLGELNDFAFSIMAAMAAAESENISRRLKAKYEQTYKAGLPKPGKSGFGYELPTEPPYYREVPHEAEVLREMAKRFLAGEKLARIVEWANEDESRWPRPFERRLEDGTEEMRRRPWTIQSVQNSLKRPLLAGHVHREDPSSEDDRPIDQIRPGAWLETAGPIIPFTEWREISEKLGQRVVETDEGLKLMRIKNSDRSFKPVGLLTGFLFTSPKGERMSATTTSKRKGAGGKPSLRYNLYEAPSGKCSIQREYLDQHIFEMVEELERLAPMSEESERERRENEAELGRKREKLDGLAMEYWTGDLPMSDDKYRSAVAKLSQQISVLEAKVALAPESIWKHVRIHMPAFENPVLSFSGVDVSRTFLAPWWDQASLDDKRALLRTRIQRIFITSTADGIERTRGNMTDYEWRQVEDKTMLKTRARTWVVRLGSDEAESWDGSAGWESRPLSSFSQI